MTVQIPPPHDPLNGSISALNDRITVILDRLTDLRDEWVSHKLGRTLVGIGAVLVVSYLVAVIGSGVTYFQGRSTFQDLQGMKQSLIDLEQISQKLGTITVHLEKEAERASEGVMNSRTSQDNIKTGTDAAVSLSAKTESETPSGSSAASDILDRISAAAAEKKAKRENRRRALELAEGLLPPEEVAQLRRAVEAHEAHDSMDYSKAARLFADLAKEDPDTTSHLNNAGAAYYRMGMAEDEGSPKRAEYLDKATDFQMKAYNKGGSDTQWSNVFTVIYKRKGPAAAMTFMAENPMNIFSFEIGTQTVIGRAAHEAGDKKKAAEIAENVLSKGDEGKKAFEDDPDFRYVRTDQHYLPLLKKYGLR